MSTKYISTTYTAGYTLAPIYTQLDIEQSGVIGGGLTLTGGHAVSVIDDGTVVGATGAPGEAGGVGLTMAGTVSLAGTGVIRGGAAGEQLELTAGAGGVGVSLAAGANLTITRAKISGGYGAYGQAFDEPAGAGGTGVYLASGSSVTMTSGEILGGGGGGGDSSFGGAGGAAAYLSPFASLTTAGLIVGGAGGRDWVGGIGGAGVELAANASMTNAGSISGGVGGATHLDRASGGAGGAGVVLAGNATLTNIGNIGGGNGGPGYLGRYDGAAGDGVDVSVGGTVVNGDRHHRGAKIIGLIGVSVAGIGTVTNFATIEGTGGTAVVFTNAGDRLIVEAHAVFVGAVAGGGGVLELGARDGPGTISGLGTTLTGFGAYQIDAGATWTFGGSDTLTPGGTLINKGTLAGDLVLGASSDWLTVEAGSDITGVVTGAGGTLKLAAASGTITGLGAIGTVSGGEAMTFSGFGSYDFVAGSSWTLAGPSVLAAGQTLANAGTLAGTLALGAASDCVRLASGGVFENIVNGDGGTLKLAGASGTITGLGAIGTASGGEAMTFSGFGSYEFVAGSSSSLVGTNILAASQTLANAGTVNGIFMLGAASDCVTLETGGVFVDVVHGGGATLRLAGAGGTISGLGGTGVVSGADAMTFSGFGSYDFARGSSSTLAGKNASATALTDAGTLTIAGSLVGSLDLSAAAARLIVKAGSSISGQVGGGDGTLELGAVSGTITGLGATGTLSGGAAMTFSDFGTYDLDAKAAWTVIGANSMSASLTNAGSLTIAGGASLRIKGAVENGGVLETSGTLTLNGAVSGAGTAVIDAGTFDAGSTFAQNVAFSGTTGVLELADATTYTGAITGFSTDGGTSLDLRDINFLKSTQATFRGSQTGGVLTVTDGTNTANFKLKGDYLDATFIATRDGHGGTVVTIDPTAPAWSPLSLRAFVDAMAGLNGPAGEALPAGHVPPSQAFILMTPRVQLA